MLSLVQLAVRKPGFLPAQVRCQSCPGLSELVFPRVEGRGEVAKAIKRGTTRVEFLADGPTDRRKSSPPVKRIVFPTTAFLLR